MRCAVFCCRTRLLFAVAVAVCAKVSSERCERVVQVQDKRGQKRPALAKFASAEARPGSKRKANGNKHQWCNPIVCFLNVCSSKCCRLKLWLKLTIMD